MADLTSPIPQPSTTSTPRQRLFRAQSLQARELSWQGRPALALRLPTTFTCLASVALAAATAALVAFGGYSRRVDMEGVVLPSSGLVMISAPAAGWIEELAVHDGEIVDKGAALYTLDLDTATKSGGTQQTIINVLTSERAMLGQEIGRKTRVSEVTQAELQRKVENLRAQIEKMGEQVATQRGFFKTVSDEYNLFQGLVERRQASLNEMNVRRQAWMQSQSKLQELESAKLRLQAELNEAEYRLATNAVTTSSEIGVLKGKMLEIDEKLANTEARRSIQIRSPAAGVVTAIVAYPGQTVASGAPMLKIVPRDAKMQAELLAPSSAIGFIRQGEQVLLRYSAFPYQKFGEYRGTVISISHAALSPEEVSNLLDGAPQAEQTGPFYRVVVKPDDQHVNVRGEERKLPASMHVQAYALLDRRPLYQWILQPLYDLGRIARRS